MYGNNRAKLRFTEGIPAGLPGQPPHPLAPRAPRCWLSLRGRGACGLPSLCPFSSRQRLPPDALLGAPAPATVRPPPTPTLRSLAQAIQVPSGRGHPDSRARVKANSVSGTKDCEPAPQRLGVLTLPSPLLSYPNGLLPTLPPRHLWRLFAPYHPLALESLGESPHLSPELRAPPDRPSVRPGWMPHHQLSPSDGPAAARDLRKVRTLSPVAAHIGGQPAL